MQIAIIGGGVGGLATALRLQQHGFQPRIYESTTELREVGVGIAVRPYGVRELDEIGILDKIIDVSVDAVDSVFFNQHGQQLYAEKCGVHMGYSHPERWITRAALQKVLYDAVIERLGTDAVVLGARATAIRNGEHGVEVNFLSRTSTAPESIRADVVIGCDGTKSVIRRSLHPDLSKAKYSGVTMWRGVTPMKPYLNGATILHIGAPSQASLITYPVAEAAPGEALVNWALETYGAPESTEDWNHSADPAEVAHLFPDWDADFLDVTNLIRSASAAYVVPMMDHDPLDSWTQGRVTLLGDAAHAMYPRGGNGFGQALLDAGALARGLAGHADPAEGLLAYEQERREKVNRVVIANRGEGPEIIRRLVEERTGGKRFDRIEDVLPAAEADAIVAEYHRLAGMTLPTDVVGTDDAAYFDNAMAKRIGAIVGPRE